MRPVPEVTFGAKMADINRAASPDQTCTSLTPSEEKSLERYIRREAERLNRKDPP